LQIAEALLQRAAGNCLRVASAGSAPSGYVHPLSIKAVAELGLDISEARSKSLDEIIDQDVETVITVCGNADQVCPVFPGQARRYHWPFDEPAHAEGLEEEQMEVFRRVRDEIDQTFSAYGLDRKDATP
jgi:arsenate reductase